MHREDGTSVFSWRPDGSHWLVAFEGDRAYTVPTPMSDFAVRHRALLIAWPLLGWRSGGDRAQAVRGDGSGLRHPPMTPEQPGATPEPACGESSLTEA